MNFYQLSSATTLACLISVSSVSAAPPKLKTEGTVIYLADNLDEADKLGWCIDTVGRGFAEELHAHSCKPRGGDVQFGYNANDRQIYSVEFPGKCMTVIDADHASIPLGLLDCETSNPAQQFELSADNRELQLSSDKTKCVVVGQASRSAGPFMSRDLIISSCNSVDIRFKQWLHQL